MNEKISDESWDIMSGNAVEDKQEITISGSGMTKIEFDNLILSLQIKLELDGWVKSGSGYKPNDDFEVRFKLKRGDNGNIKQ